MEDLSEEIAQQFNISILEALPMVEDKDIADVIEEMENKATNEIFFIVKKMKIKHDSAPKKNRSEKNLRDIAMRTATGTLTTECFDYDTFMDVNFDLAEYVWEPLEDYSESEYEEAILQAYYSILSGLRAVSK
jgi:hypothetical protein